MRPNEYDFMVEKLAEEIIEDVFEKSAYTQEQWNKMSKAEQRALLEQGQRQLQNKRDALNSNKITSPAVLKKGRTEMPITKHDSSKHVAPPVGPSKASTLWGKAKDKGHDTVMGMRYGTFTDPREQALRRAQIAKYAPKALAGAGILAGTGLAAKAVYDYRKKKKEEQKEKVAAYYEDALFAKQAAEEAWALADQYEDSMAVGFIKQAAEEAYENAEAYAEAAENVFAAIENDEFYGDYE